MNISKKSCIYVILLIFTTLTLVALIKYGISRREATTSVGTITYVGPEIPIYPDSVLIDSIRISEGDDFNYKSVWETKDSVPTIASWYVKNLPNSDWKLDLLPADPSAQDVQLVVALKGDRVLNVSVILDREKGGTKIVAEDNPLPSTD